MGILNLRAYIAQEREYQVLSALFIYENCEIMCFGLLSLKRNIKKLYEQCIYAPAGAHLDNYMYIYTHVYIYISDELSRVCVGWVCVGR